MVKIILTVSVVELGGSGAGWLWSWVVVELGGCGAGW